MLQRMVAEDTLWAAWARTAAGTGMPGTDGVSVQQFGKRLGTHLDTLAQDLRSGTYTPHALRGHVLRRDGKERKLAIPSVRDRVAQQAFLRVAGRRFDAELANACFAYRRGRSWLDALRKAERCREQGLRWVFRGDIADYFGTIDHTVLRRQLDEVLRHDPLLDIVMSWVAAPVVTTRGLEAARGVPQGSPVGPALANHYLAAFDATVDGKHGRLLRYADDMAVFCADEEGVIAARNDVIQALHGLRLQLNEQKTYISHFDQGFSLLGWVFFRDDGYEESPTESWTHPMTFRERVPRKG